jgi:peptidoglycan/xylan/chitin deacetylase (PgdA/CDA1 family)
MEIGSHGRRHRPGLSLDSDALDEELVQARAILESVTGRPVTLAACPLGSYDRHVLRALRDAGYRHAYTSDRGVAAPGDFLQVRNSLGPDSEPGVVERIGSAGAPLGRRVQLAVKRWR